MPDYGEHVSTLQDGRYIELPDRYAVIGQPIAHTKSPFIHQAFAQATGQNMDYTAIEGRIEPAAFREQVFDLFRTGRLLGLNVTLPFKLEALALADRALDRAQAAGASNALKWVDGQIIADNFDGIGLLRDIEVNLSFPLKGKRLLILGAGGSVRGAILPFLKAEPKRIVIANRTVHKAQEIADFNATYGHIEACGYADLRDEPFDIVLNFTSTGILGEDLPIPPRVFEKAKLAYELAYGKGKTAFLKQAERHSQAHLVDGVGMLVEQAAEAFEWWRGVRPPTRKVIEQLTVPL
jgi:shikimate dehydrogenase